MSAGWRNNTHLKFLNPELSLVSTIIPIDFFHRLSLSANLIGQDGLEISRFPYLEYLEFLGLFGNFLTDFENLLSLLKIKTPHLKEIYTAANPCTMVVPSGCFSQDHQESLQELSPGTTGIETTDSCKSQLIQALPDLIRIDGILVTRRNNHSNPSWWGNALS